ncbi:unnamed protein product [Thelazia callipaeda]|uniref:Phosphorylase b kinase regulatory subunit n=1 Tax=Thelazia callipaeda TaxID=103827 RepID=A0A0N5CJK5_THECL|nr:unnamed protein product [Thelazia callipaeda]
MSAALIIFISISGDDETKCDSSLLDSCKLIDLQRDYRSIDQLRGAWSEQTDIGDDEFDLNGISCVLAAFSWKYDNCDVLSYNVLYRLMVMMANRGRLIRLIMSSCGEKRRDEYECSLFYYYFWLLLMCLIDAAMMEDNLFSIERRSGAKCAMSDTIGQD